MIKLYYVLAVIFATYTLLAQNTEKKPQSNDSLLLNQYINSQGKEIIIFDVSNIKQFWIDKTVISKQNSFEIVLQHKNQINESIPLQIQLINVDETEDCTIEVISDDEQYGFQVLNKKGQVISDSIKGDDFINYKVMSTSFHLEDTLNKTFDIIFQSKEKSVLSIKTIILSFSKNINSCYLTSPGFQKFTKNNIAAESIYNSIEDNQTSFLVTGKQSRIIVNKRIIVSDTPLLSSVTLKNMGETDTRVYYGYILFSKNNIQLDSKNYPYKQNSKSLKIISVSDDKKKILVDAYPDWGKKCYLAINVKDDMSDVPNTRLGNGTIIEIIKRDDGQAEIILDKPLPSSLEKNDKVRVHGLGGAFLYTLSPYILHAGEEKVLSSKIQRDINLLEYSSTGIPSGVYCVVPVILSYSIDSKRDNTIQISDFTITF